MVTTVAHDIGPTKEEPVSRWSDQNTDHISALRFGIYICIFRSALNVYPNQLCPDYPFVSVADAF